MTARRQFLLTVILLLPSPALAGSAEEAAAMVDRWAVAFNSGDADTVLKLYSTDAILLAAGTPAPIEGAAAIRSYFARVPALNMKVTLGERRTQVLNDTAALVAGDCDYTALQNGKFVASPSRFTIVVVKHGADWLIVHHNSAPRPSAAP